MKFVHWKELFESLQVLMSKGGKFGKAAAQVAKVLHLAQRKNILSEVFSSITTTNHGENRVQHCVKYDLQGACRLITVQDNDICFLMFAGTHDDCDSWLERNRGIRFHARTIDGHDVIESTRVSDDLTVPSMRLRTVPDFAAGPLFKKLSGRYFERLCEGLEADLIDNLREVSCTISDDDLLQLALMAEDRDAQDLIYDTFELLRAGLISEAKNRIDLARKEVRSIETITSLQKNKLVSGDEVVMNDDVDPILFEHFLRTSSFQKWMVYLHPGQREFVSKNFSSSARLAGVSGSGKTSVLIHRAVRLARENPNEKILVITLNRSLSRMIKDLTSAVSGEMSPDNLKVLSFWELCREKLLTFEPHNKLIYSDKTEKTNQFAVSEHIDEIWGEFFECRANNDAAKVLRPLIKTLVARKIFASDYIRQEFDFVRSALGPNERNMYLSLDRVGRAIGLTEDFRSAVLRGLAAWEDKMFKVGAVDYLGIASALYKYLDKISPEYRFILVDEMQDFGALELRIIRAFTKKGVNDIFLCGDLAQSVMTKYHKVSESGIDVNGRSHTIRKNYRNSKQILSAAFELFARNRNLIASATNVEILDPEYANFSSSPPLLLSAENFDDEINYSLSYLKDLMQEDAGRSRKYCISVCGVCQSQVEKLAALLNLSVLNGEANLSEGNIFISDLEQTKGFEFDSMIILNCSSVVIPHPALPEEESYRDLCKLYVAMTRAKTELIVSYSGTLSCFMSGVETKFTSSTWETYSSKDETLPSVSYIFDRQDDEADRDWLKVDGLSLLCSIHAVGLSNPAQDKLLKVVTGTRRLRNRRKVEWQNFEEFFKETKVDATLRNVNNISDEVWEEFNMLYDRMSREENIRSERSLHRLKVIKGEVAKDNEIAASQTQRPILRLKRNTSM